jgi:Homeodomain-like domain
MLRISDIVRRKEFSENVSMKTTVTLNSQEQQRIKRLNEHMAGLLSVEQVAELMQVSKRQVYRWKASYREKGVEAFHLDMLHPLVYYLSNYLDNRRPSDAGEEPHGSIRKQTRTNA